MCSALQFEARRGRRKTRLRAIFAAPGVPGQRMRRLWGATGSLMSSRARVERNAERKHRPSGPVAWQPVHGKN